MHQQPLFIRLSLLVLFINSFSVASDDSGVVYDKAIDDLSLILSEEPRVGAGAINRLQKEIISDLKKQDLFSAIVMAAIFRSALIQHLAEHQVTLTPGLLVNNVSSVCYHINSVFSPDLKSWTEFIENIGLFSGNKPDDKVVQEAFEVVRKKTAGPYLKHADYLRRQFNAIAANNSIPALKDSE